jgi:hypothetical protein
MVFSKQMEKTVFPQQKNRSLVVHKSWFFRRNKLNLSPVRKLKTQYMEPHGPIEKPAKISMRKSSLIPRDQFEPDKPAIVEEH